MQKLISSFITIFKWIKWKLGSGARGWQNIKTWPMKEPYLVIQDALDTICGDLR